MVWTGGVCGARVMESEIDRLELQPFVAFIQNLMFAEDIQYVEVPTITIQCRFNGTTDCKKTDV